MSLVSVNNVSTNKYELEVKIDAKTFGEGIEKAYRKNVKSISIPGFRKGKAPRKMIERMYGENVFFEDAINIVYPMEVNNAVKDSELELVSTPEVEVLEANLEEGVILKVICITKPKIELKQYKEIEVEKTKIKIESKDVDEELQKMREKNARIITVEDRPVQKDDEVVIDFEGFVDGESFEGGKSENHSLVIGSNQFIPGFEDQLIGCNVNEQRDINVTFPEKYHAKSLAGKDAVFKVKINEIKCKELPELDDEFVKDVSEHNTLEELRQDVQSKLEKRVEENAEKEVESSIIEKLISNIEGEIPDVMYENRMDELARDFEQNIRAQGMDIGLYLQYAGLTPESFRESFRANATSQVNLRIALERIGELEDIQVTQQEIDDKYEELKEMYKMSVEKIKEYVSADNIKADIVVAKAADLVKESAKVVEKDFTYEQDNSEKDEGLKTTKSTKTSSTKSTKTSGTKSTKASGTKSTKASSTKSTKTSSTKSTKTSGTKKSKSEDSK